MRRYMNLLAGLALVLPIPAVAGDPRARDMTNFVRLVYYQTSREDPGRWIGQASVRELRHPESGVSVTLLSLVHIGRADYYRSLTPHLRDAEVVLAEGGGQAEGRRVKDEDLPPDGLWVRRAHAACARLLDLVEQGDWEASVVDKRWVIADMEQDRLFEAVRAGQLPFPEKLKPVIESWEALLRGSPSAEELARARESASANVMRQFYEFTDPTGPERTLHERREEVLWQVLKERLASGKQKRIAVVYGAWHVCALEERLVRELGFRVEATCWHDCQVFEKPAKAADEKR